MPTSWIPRTLWRRLRRVRPSRDGSLELRPCQVLLKEGRWVDRVYLVEETAYLRHWQLPPGEDPSRRPLPVEAVADVAESSARLPARFADRLYRAGESGKGYALFTLILSNGRRLPYQTGHAVDFPQWPDDVTPDLVEEVLPHEAPEEFRHRTPEPDEAAAPHFWCLYRRPPPRWPGIARGAWGALTWGCGAVLAMRGQILLSRIWPQLAELPWGSRVASLRGRPLEVAALCASVALEAGLLAAPLVRRRSPGARLAVLLLMLPAIFLSARLLAVDHPLFRAEGARTAMVLNLVLWLVPPLNAALLALPRGRDRAGEAAPPSAPPAPPEAEPQAG